jgi:hypothetical protein
MARGPLAFEALGFLLHVVARTTADLGALQRQIFAVNAASVGRIEYVLGDSPRPFENIYLSIWQSKHGAATLSGGAAAPTGRRLPLRPQRTAQPQGQVLQFGFGSTDSRGVHSPQQGRAQRDWERAGPPVRRNEKCGRSVEVGGTPASIITQATACKFPSKPAPHVMKGPDAWACRCLRTSRGARRG